MTNTPRLPHKLVVTKVKPQGCYRVECPVTKQGITLADWPATSGEINRHRSRVTAEFLAAAIKASHKEACRVALRQGLGLYDKVPQNKIKHVRDL